MSATGVNDLIMEVIRSTNETDDKVRLIDEIRKARPPLQDRWLYRYVVWALAVVAILTVIAGFFVDIKEGGDLPAGIVAIGSAAVGALATLISPGQQPKETGKKGEKESDESDEGEQG